VVIGDSFTDLVAGYFTTALLLLLYYCFTTVVSFTDLVAGYRAGIRELVLVKSSLHGAAAAAAVEAEKVPYADVCCRMLTYADLCSSGGRGCCRGREGALIAP
jgi:hypothetical protein